MTLPPRTLRWAVTGAAAILVVGAAWWSYGLYGTRRDGLDREIERYRVDLDRMTTQMGEQSRIKKRLGELAVGTLGENEETVSASIRTALNEIVAHCGLGNTSVATRDAEARKTPAAGASEFNTPIPGSKAKLRELTDFYTMPASVTGSGTLEQVMRALATIQSQPWARRIDSVSLRPVGGKERSRMELAVHLTTVFLPGIKPAQVLETAWVKPDPGLLASAGLIVAKDAFREKPVPAVAAAPPAAPSMAVAPYADWRVTAVVKGLAGPELWLTNEKTRQNLSLAVGQAVMDAVFLGAAGEVARIKIGEQEYEVALAQTLQDRKVVTR